MRNNISANIKSILKKAGVTNKVSTYCSTITVVFLSPVTTEIVDQIKALETVEAHGDSMNDTRYYTGLSIQFDYKWAPTNEEIEKAKELYNSWSDDSKKDRNSFSFHFEKQLKKEIGPIGPKLADQLIWKRI